MPVASYDGSLRRTKYVLKTFSITDIGKKRKENQDFVYTSERPIGNLPNVFISTTYSDLNFTQVLEIEK